MSTDAVHTDRAAHIAGMTTNRPNLQPYFAARISHHVNGMLSRSVARLPHDVCKLDGDVTDSTITATMCDGTEWKWTGGRYAARKVNRCYAPLMPRPAK